MNKRTVLYSSFFYKLIIFAFLKCQVLVFIFAWETNWDF